VLPPILFDFIDGGSGDEVTLHENERAFRDVVFKPHVGVQVGDPDLSTTVLGQHISLPVMAAPCGGVSMVHPDGQAGVLRAMEARGSIGSVSTMCGNDLASLDASGAGGPAGGHWFQLYKVGGRSGAEQLIDLAEQSGYQALVVAVDTPVIGRKDRDLRHGGIRPGGVSISKIDLPTIAQYAPKVISRPGWLLRFARSGFPVGQPSLINLSDESGSPLSLDDAYARWRADPAVWADLEWIRERWTGPMVVKGVLGGDDARTATDLGADAVVISNHGGRQLDGAPATIAVLPEVVAAVPSGTEVYLDGGVRRGADVARAIALGARAVFVGRPYLFALACGGRAGVEQLLDVLRAELTNSMQLLGCRSITELDATFLQR
jgi:isopentenyl diphosphate isomerase/L-lactate dehydrogenase-like FMN-dependent dehydrogenase